MKIYYVTGNAGKVELMNLIYKDEDIEVVQENIETPEIQSLDCKEVACFSAQYAANKLGKSVVKNDSGLVIPTLNGFPGALAKYTENTLVEDGFLNLMKDKTDRQCYWVEALSYCEPGKEPVVFESFTYGIISHEPKGDRGYPFDKLFIPDGDDRTFAEMSEEEQLSCFDNKAYIELLNYIKNK